MDYLMTVLATFTVYHLAVGGLIFLVLTVAFRWLHFFSAESQNWLWITAFVIAGGIPFTLFLQGSSTLEAFPSAVELSPVSTNLEAPVAPVAENLLTPAIGNSTSVNQKLTLVISNQWAYWLAPWFVFLLCVWGAGCIWRLGSIFQSLQKTKQLISSSRPLNTIDIFTELNCEVKVSSTTHSPLVAGLINPVIVLPSDLVNRLDADQLRPIILHEWAHICRKDLWTVLLQEMIAVVFWWSPIMRLLNRKIYITRELACDMRAARNLANPKQYARCLLECARLMVTRRHDVLAMGMFRKKQDLNKRVDHVMKMQTGKVHNGFLSVVAGLVLVLAGIVVATEVDQNVVIAKQENRTAADREQTADDVVLVKMSPESAARVKYERAQREMKARELAMRNREVEPLSLDQLKAKMLLEVVQRGDRNAVAQLLAEGIDVNTPVPRDGSALIVAAKRGNTDMVSYLIQMGADVNLAVRGDGNPLIAAAMSGHTDVATILYDSGADVNAVVEGDETPLINASRHDHLSMAELLISRGADVNLGVEVRQRNSDTVYRTPLNQARSDAMRDYLTSMGAQ